MEIKLWQERSSDLHSRRRHSLTQQPTYKDIYSHREQLRNKYNEYILQRQRSLEPKEEPTFSEEDSNNTQELKMPKINTLLRDRENIGEILRQTINRYNYARSSNQRKVMQLNRKKNKYQKILMIRQSHHIEKMQLNKSRVQLEQSISQEKQNMRKSVLVNKLHVEKSINQCLNQKKQAGDELREKGMLNKSRIVEDKKLEYERKKKICTQMSIEEKQMKVKKVNEMDKRKKMNTEKYYCRIEVELEKNKRLNKNAIKNHNKVAKKIEDLHKTKERYEKELKQFRQVLKEDYPFSRTQSINKKYFFTTSTALANSQQL